MGDKLKAEFQPGQIQTGVAPPVMGTIPGMEALGETAIAPGAPTTRPTFLSAFLQNLGPALAGGAGQSSFGAGVGGALQGIEEQKRYKQQQEFQQSQLQRQSELDQLTRQNIYSQIGRRDIQNFADLNKPVTQIRQSIQVDPTTGKVVAINPVTLESTPVPSPGGDGQLTLTPKQSSGNPTLMSVIEKSVNGTPEERAYSKKILSAYRDMQVSTSESRYGLRPVNVLDIQNGNRPQVVTVDQLLANPDKYIPASSSVPALTRTALIEDIRGNITLARNAIIGLKTPFDAKTRAQLALVLSSPDPDSAFSQFLSSTYANTLTDDQIDYVVALNQLNENAMAMRSVLGAGQGSDDLRRAIRSTIPSGATPNSKMALKQLDAFEGVLNRLSRGIPNVPLRSEGVTPPPGFELVQ